MNLKTGLVALTMAASPLVSHAQSTVKTVAKNDSIMHAVQSAVQKGDSAATIAFTEAQKLAGAAKKAPQGMVTVTRQKGKFKGKVTPQGLNGDLTYTTSSRMVRDPRLKPETNVTYGMNYVNAETLKNAGSVSATVEKGKTAIKAEAILGKKDANTNGMLKLNASQNYDLGAGFSAGPQIGLHGNLQKVNNDIKGSFAPELSAGVKFKHEFDNGMRVGADMSAGAAAPLGYNNRTTSVGSVVETYKANASVGFKDVEVVAGAGKDVHLGKNVTAGIRYTF